MQVDRILTRRPSLLLVERGISRIACAMLNDAGVRVVLNLSPRVLRRVARATGAEILPACDAQFLQDTVGFCPMFAQREETLKNGTTKQFLVSHLLLNESAQFFEDCPTDKGCSVLLKGPSARELRAAKRIFSFFVSLLYSAELEKAFLSMHGMTIAGAPVNCEVCEARREVINEDYAKVMPCPLRLTV